MATNINLMGNDPVWLANLRNYEWFRKWEGITRADAATAFSSGLRGGFGHMGSTFSQASGLGYVRASLDYYASRPTRMTGPGIGAVWTERVEAAMAEGHGIWAARARAVPGATRAAGGRMAGFLKMRGGIGKPIMAGLLPAAVLYGAAHSEHGFGVGLAEETAGMAAFSIGSSMGMHMGGWAGATATGRLGSVLSRVSGSTRVGAGIRFIGGTAGLSVGFLAGGLIAFEAARWTVGFALHTLPTFSRQFQADMARQGFGGDYQDSAGAATMRARSLQVMGRSFANARSALGQEAALLHI